MYDLVASSSVQYWQFESAKRYLDDGITYTSDHDLDSWRVYMQGWQALSLVYRGQWDEAASLAQTLTHLSSLSPIVE